MPRGLLPCAILLSLALFGCANRGEKKEVKVYPAGDKAVVGPLSYTVVDTQMLLRLGDDPDTARNAQNRFVLVKLAVSNSANAEQPIPAMTLIDDAGQIYPELADGSNVPDWLGVIRKVPPAQTGQGTVIFDAPAKHYRLKLTDDTTNDDIAIDIPLTFIHEQMQSGAVASPATRDARPGSR
jgi:hypothetical protein